MGRCLCVRMSEEGSSLKAPGSVFAHKGHKGQGQPVRDTSLFSAPTRANNTARPVGTQHTSARLEGFPTLTTPMVSQKNTACNNGTAALGTFVLDGKRANKGLHYWPVTFAKNQRIVRIVSAGLNPGSHAGTRARRLFLRDNRLKVTVK